MVTVFVLRFDQADIDTLQEVQVETTASGKPKSGGRIESCWALPIDTKRGETERGQSFKRNPKRRTGRERVEGVDVSKMITGLDHTTEILVRPIRGRDRKSFGNSLVATDR